MELKDFVKKALIDISEAVVSAQDESLVWIAPGYVEHERVTEPQLVSFDIAISVSKEAGGSISLFSFGEAKGAATSEHLNKISFSVPVHFNAPTERHPRHYSRMAAEQLQEK